MADRFRKMNAEDARREHQRKGDLALLVKNLGELRDVAESMIDSVRAFESGDFTQDDMQELRDLLRAWNNSTSVIESGMRSVIQSLRGV
jgi:hypothetical protein